MCDSHQPLNGADSEPLDIPQAGDCYSFNPLPMQQDGWCDAHENLWQAHQPSCNATMTLAELRA